jgi:UDP-sugar transporter A1/2/3
MAFTFPSSNHALLLILILQFFLGTCVVLFATYLYTKPERSPLQIPLSEKPTIERTPSAYGYSDAHGSMAKADGLGNPPGTPTQSSKREA